jgi:flavin reductase (DIM6/NTAB) family NADH-FMN oxidoreductase RutF
VARLLDELDGEAVIIDPSQESAQNIYKLMVGAIVPRPIAFVSTVSAAGVPTLAPFSFFTAISANPPVICFSPAVRASDGLQKDTLRNIEATGEFVVNVVSEEFAAQMNACSAEFPPEVNEFEVSGLTAVPSELVKPPRVAESRIQMECRLVQVVHVSAKPLGGSLVIGEVLRFHVDEAVCQDFRIDPDQLRAIGRMGGPTYARTADRFDMPRPTACGADPLVRSRPPGRLGEPRGTRSE